MSAVAQTVRVHELKADPIPFTAVLSGEKVAEVRVNDRDFQAGDVLRMREYDRSWHHEPTGDGWNLVSHRGYTGRECTRTVTHVQTGYGLPDGLVVLSLGWQCECPETFPWECRCDRCRIETMQLVPELIAARDAGLADTERINHLEALGVVSIYLRAGSLVGSQINPGSTSLRAALDGVREVSGG